MEKQVRFRFSPWRFNESALRTKQEANAFHHGASSKPMLVDTQCNKHVRFGLHQGVRRFETTARAVTTFSPRRFNTGCTSRQRSKTFEAHAIQQHGRHRVRSSRIASATFSAFTNGAWHFDQHNASINTEARAPPYFTIGMST